MTTPAPTPAPHIHLDKIIQWAQDTSRPVYCSERGEFSWVLIDKPFWEPNRDYHVGPNPPKKPEQPETCTLAGVAFPIPAQEPLKNGQEYWVAYVSCPETLNRLRWAGEACDRHFLASGLVQLTREGATAQGRALRAVMQQAIKEAK